MFTDGIVRDGTPTQKVDTDWCDPPQALTFTVSVPDPFVMPFAAANGNTGALPTDEKLPELFVNKLAGDVCQVIDDPTGILFKIILAPPEPS